MGCHFTQRCVLEEHCLGQRPVALFEEFSDLQDGDGVHTEPLERGGRVEPLHRRFQHLDDDFLKVWHHLFRCVLGFPR